MIKDLLRKLLHIEGIEDISRIEEIERRVSKLEADKADLETRLIDRESTRMLILDASRYDELTNDMVQHLKDINVPDSKNTGENAVAEMKAADMVQRYGFKRYIHPIEQPYPSRVISLKELQQHPEKYFHKLNRGFLGFPVGLNFDEVNKFLFKMFGNVKISNFTNFSNNGSFEFAPISMISGCKGGDLAHAPLIRSMELSDLNRHNGTMWIYMDTLDFLANYDGLEACIVENPTLVTDEKKRGLQALRTAKLIYLTALEIVGLTRIKDPKELLKYDKTKEGNEGDELMLLEDSEQLSQIKQGIRYSLLTKPKGTTYDEIQKLLPIRSRERFRQLAAERTAEILTHDEEYRGLTQTIEKPLEGYSVGDSIALACYFARNIIKRYETLDDAVQNVLSGNENNEVSGKCTDYTALALHYLQEYLIPLHPKQFENWRFGFDADKIGGYNHCYMKAIHINPDQTIDVYFIDPTLLANKGIEELKTPEGIMEQMNTSNFPVLIERDAEDLLYKPS